MPAISQADFDDHTNAAMVEIATLLRVVQQLKQMEPTFTNSVDIDKVVATPMAMYVIKFAKDAATALLEELYKNPKNRKRGLPKLRKRRVTRLKKAIAMALQLSNMERTAMQAAGAKGNVIQHLVLEPLQQLNW